MYEEVLCSYFIRMLPPGHRRPVIDHDRVHSTVRCLTQAARLQEDSTRLIDYQKFGRSTVRVAQTFNSAFALEIETPSVYFAFCILHFNLLLRALWKALCQVASPEASRLRERPVHT